MHSHILVTGSNGQLGKELQSLVKSKFDDTPNATFYFEDKNTLDIRNKDDVEDFIEKKKIDIIVNCAAYTAVDRAEGEKTLAFQVNHEAVATLADLAKEKDIFLLHVSTDYVFSGNSFSPISEEVVPSPKSVYGASKLAGEDAIRHSAPRRALILRTSWVYSQFGHNFLQTMLRLGKIKNEITVVSDQLGTPTNARDLAMSILSILKSEISNPTEGIHTYHYSNEGSCSWYDFAKSIFNISHTSCEVKPICTEQYPTVAKRPYYSVLDKRKIKEKYNLNIAHWRDSLEDCVRILDNGEQKIYKIGIIGSGFIAQGLANQLMHSSEYEVVGVLTRTDVSKRKNFSHPELLTNSLDKIISSSDLIVECTGDALYATESIDAITKAGLPVVTMNSEFHVTTGSYFVDKGLVTEAEGDQPGVLAMLHEEAIQMGFKPVLYANIKGFLNENPTREDMKYWGNKSNLSLEMVTSFTDGTKVQIEQTLVVNGLGANIIKEGLVKLKSDNMLEGGTKLVNMAKEQGVDLPISDYVLSSTLPAGVFVLLQHEEEQADSLKYYKLGDGPYYVLERTYHLCHLEIIKTLKRVLAGGDVLLDNSTTPRFSVAAFAKKDLKAGQTIDKGIGGFDVRGSMVKIVNHPNHIPIGTLVDATLKRDIKEGEMLTFDDVDMPMSMALDIWKNKILSKIL